MTTRYFRFIVLLAFITALATSLVEAHPNHKIMGMVTMVAADHVMVKDRDGKEHTIILAKTTRVTRNKKVIKAAEIPVGARVVATLVSDTDFTARMIEVGIVPASK
jgi:hypothetical protein